MKNKANIGIITQARSTSSRLPGKVLIKVGDATILSHHIKRLQSSGFEIFIATTENSSDDPIAAFCTENNYPFFRGSESNVLDRYYKTAKKFNLDIIIRVTSDCPLIDGNVIKSAVAEYLLLNDDEVYLSNGIERTFPRGFDFEIFSLSLLEDAWRNATEDFEKEHVTPYLYQGKNKRIKIKQFLHNTDKSRYRLTLDTKEDYELLRILIEDYHADKKSVDEIISIMDNHPELSQINKDVEQKKLGQ